MSVTHARSAGLPNQHRGAVIWIGVFTLLLSLLTPLITLEVADAKAAAAELAQGEPPNCDPGFVVDEASNTCVEDPNAQLPQQPQCAEGEIVDPSTNTCIPDPNLQPETQPVYIQVDKYDCPPGTDWYQAGYDQLAGGCFANQNPVSFTIDGSPQQVTSQGQWGPFDPGSHQITETVPDTYGSPVVFCGAYLPNQSQPSLQPLGQTDTVQWDLASGEVLYCQFYNISTAQNSITVYKWDCVEGTEYGQTLEYYQGEGQDTGPCETEHLNIPISLIHGGPQQDTTTQANGTQFNGVVLANDAFQIFIDEPDGYGDPMVFCGTLDDQTQTPYPAPGGTWSITPADVPFTYQCNVYDIPAPANSITVYKWDCAPGTEYGQSLEYYQGGLPEQDTGPCESEHLNIPISLIHGGPQQDTTTQANGTEFDDVILANGSFQITIDEPDGYGDPMVFCGTLDEETQSPVTATGGTFTITPTSEPFTYQCNAYDIPTGYGQILIEKYWCPPGLAFVQAPTQSDLQGACQEIGPQTSFSLDGPGGPYEDQSVDGNPADNVLWQLTEGGQYTVTENFPEGEYTLTVFCHLAPLQGDNNVQVDPEQWEVLNGNSIQWTAEEGYIWVCAIFNFPTDTGNSITVYKWECVEGTEYGRELDYYQGGLPDQDTGPCESEHLNIPISLIHGGPQQDTTTQANGTQFDNVVLANGSFQITITEPEGFGDPMVFCGTLDEETQSPVTATGGTFTLTPATSPFTYQCNAYDIPAGENSITVYKWDCVEGTEYGQTLEYYQGEGQDTAPCETEHLNIPISLIHGGPQQDTTTQANGTQFNDVVLSNGSFQVFIDEPDGYGDPMVFCGTLDDETQTPYPAPGGTWTITPASEPFTYQCNVYDVLAGDNSITVYKWDCAPGTEYGQSHEYYQGGLPEQDTGPCESEHLNIPISLIHGGPQQDTTTQANGTQFNDVVPDQNGSFQITIDEPDGYGDPMVFCGTLDEETQSPVTATGGTWTLTPTTTPFTYQCNAYDIPGAEPFTEGTHWITIYKYYCSTETQTSEDLAFMQEACTEYHNGVPFSLSGGNLGNPSEQTTVGGSVEWTDLAAGSYTIAETLPPDYQPPLIWCGYVVQGGAPIELASQQFDPYTATDGGIQLTLEGESSRIVCYWYNFGDPESSVTVYKYDCDFAPPGYQSLSEWQDACPTKGDGYTFTLTDSEATAEDMVTANGTASWTGVPEGEFSLAETIPSGWGEPIVWCGWSAYWNGAIYDAFPQQVTTTGGVYHGEISVPNTTYFCYWFNIPVDYSSITVIKYNCPEGYLEGVVENPLGAYQELCTTPGNGIEFTLENSAGSSSATVLGGQVKWTDVPLGEFTITETVPPGYDPPLWFCGPYGEIVPIEGASPSYTGSIDSHPTDWICYVFDFPNQDRTVVVYKWLCPEGYEGTTYEEWSGNCTMPWDGVSYTLTDVNGDWTLPTVGGLATWYGTGQGDVTLDEHIPPGYFEPVVYCSLEAIQDGAAYAEDWTQVPSTNGAISRTLDYEEYQWVCHYYNIPKGPGEITVYKWQCPPGYDFYAWGSNPSVDCNQPWDGVTFTLDQPVGPNLQGNTGDSIPGAVYFGGLDPGDYVITETVPADIEQVFWLSCTGSDDDKVNPYPLMWGNTLPIKVAGGDAIVCHVYNVPYPDNGWVTVYKYQCWTSKYTSPVDCEIYEYGATFELFGWPSETSHGTGTTNNGGLYTWNNLEEGAYTLDEISHKPCKITSTKTDGEGHAWVDAGQGTIIKVYNCKSSSTVTPTPTTPGGTPPKTPGKVPGKYPNTGVGPEAIDSFVPSLQGTPTPPVNEAPEDEYYRISCLEGTPAASPPATETATAATEGTPAATGTPEEFDLPIDEEGASTPAAEGTPGAEEDCERGALPERVVIDAAQVDAGVETLEIVDGIMQMPTGPELVTWYKETGRLGEPNNVVIAGHLNYWNVPEGVFFYLSQLREGDRIEITGDDGMIYVYEVQWVRQESNLEPPAADVIGPTDEPSLTLITCGGEWNAGLSEYDERTVARAVQVDVIAAEDTGDEAAYSPLHAT